MDFNNSIWNLLVDHGSSDRRKAECEQLWNTFSEEEQQQIYSRIRDKMANNRFVHYDPVRALSENRLPVTPPEPHFLSGREQDEYWKSNDWVNKGKFLVQVRYRDEFKICTQETWQDFNLEKNRYIFPPKD